MRTDRIDRPYLAIACGAYDVLEASTIRKRKVRLDLIEGDPVEGLIIDVFARGKEEFCRLQPLGGAPPLELRLDSIRQIIDVEDGSITSTRPC